MLADSIFIQPQDLPQQKSQSPRKGGHWHVHPDADLTAAQLALVTQAFPEGMEFEDIGLLLGITGKHAEMEYLRAVKKLRSRAVLMDKFKRAVQERRHQLDAHRGNGPWTDIDADLDVDMSNTV